MARNELVRQARAVTIKGSPDHVRTVLRTYALRGDLHTDPSQIRFGRSGDDVVTTVELMLPPEPKRRTFLPGKNTVGGQVLRALLFSVACVAAVFGLLLLAMHLLRAVVAEGAALVAGMSGGIILLIVLGAVIFAALPGAHPGSCPCPNCKH